MKQDIHGALVLGWQPYALQCLFFLMLTSITTGNMEHNISDSSETINVIRI
jgi:hypothetical protein